MAFQRRITWLGAPFFAAFLLIYIAPMLGTVYHSFQSGSFNAEFAGFDIYARAFSNPYFRLALGNTLRVSCALLFSALAFSAFAAYLLFRNGRAAKVGLGILLLPLFIPTASAATVWASVFDTSAFMGAPRAYAAIITLFIWKCSGVGVALFYIGLRGIPKEVLWAARIDGAGEGMTYLRVCLPCIRPQRRLARVALLMYALRIYKESYLLFGEYPCDSMYLLQHYMSNHFLKMRFPNVAVAAVALAILALIAYALLFLTGAGKEIEWSDAL